MKLGEDLRLLLKKYVNWQKSPPKQQLKLRVQLRKWMQIRYLLLMNLKQMLAKTKKTLTMSEVAKTSFDELLQEITQVTSDLQGMQHQLQAVEAMLPGLEERAAGYESVSQENLASAEQMLTTSDEQVVQLRANQQIGKQLTDISAALAQHTEQFQIS